MKNPFEVNLRFKKPHLVAEIYSAAYLVNGEKTGYGRIAISPEKITWMKFFPNSGGSLPSKFGFGAAAHMQTLHSLTELIGEEDIIEMDVSHLYYTLSPSRRVQLQGMGIDFMRDVPFLEYFEKSRIFYEQRFVSRRRRVFI